MSTFRVCTYNVGDGPDIAKVKHLEHLAERYGVTVAGLQEASDRLTAEKEFRKRNPSWRRYGPKYLRGASAVPILWDDNEWDRTHARSVLAVPRRYVGPRGAGPSFVKAKRINVLTLRHRPTGLVVTFVNTHMIPSSSRADLPAAEKKARQDHYRQHIGALVRVLDSIDGPVVLTFDANAEPGYGLLVPLRRRLEGWTEQPTHRRATYDHVLSRGLHLLDERVIEGGSDHRSVVHTYRTQEKP